MTDNDPGVGPPSALLEGLAVLLCGRDGTTVYASPAATGANQVVEIARVASDGRFGN